MIVKNSAKFTLSLLLLKVLKFCSQFLKLLYPKRNIHRIEDAIKSYISLLEKYPTNDTQKVSGFLYPGITHKPWYETQDNDVLKFVDDRLKKGFNDIQDEWLTYLSSRNKVVSIYNASEIYSHLKDEDSQKERVILLLELYHPELTIFEKALLNLISIS